MILVGTAGFSYPDWKGTVYPPDLKKRKLHELEYLSQFYDLVEINNSFYRHLEPKYAQRWCEYVGGNRAFQFTVKLNRVFTHAPDAKETSTSAETLSFSDEDVSQMKAGIAPFAEAGRLGAVLAQFPVSFKHTEGNWDYLIDLLKLFREFPLAVELREKSWLEPNALQRLGDEKVAFCNIDQPKLGNSITGTDIVTAPFGYLRLHGRNYKQWFQAKHRDQRYDYLYTTEEIRKVADVAQRMDRQAEKTFVVANNHYKGQAAVNATEIKSVLQNTKVAVPETLVRAYPQELGRIGA
jgi:uncharacterized protein YecE (DUF72 family)